MKFKGIDVVDLLLLLAFICFVAVAWKGFWPLY